MPAPRELKAQLGIVKPSEVSDSIAKLNEKHGVVMLGGKCAILNEVTDPVFGRPDITFSSPADFKTKYANRKVFVENENGDKKSHCVANVWLQDSRRREYEGIVFSPGLDTPGFYNLYRGLAVEPINGNWERLNAHIAEVICGCDTHIYDYLMAWMADTVQDPGGDRPGVSVVLRGPKGVGKGIWARSFGDLFGGHFLHISDQSQLVGKFNNHLKDALLVFADECFWAGDKLSEGTLKRMITEPTIRIEPKGKDSFSVKNHVRLIVASNEDWAAPAGLGERRFLVLDVENSQKQKVKYFDPIYKEIRGRGLNAMLYDLLKHPYDKKHLLNSPKTDALLSQIEEGMSPEQKFWLERLKDGRVLKGDTRWGVEVSSEKLYRLFLDFAKDLGRGYAPAPTSFGRRIRKLCPEVRRWKKYIGVSDYEYVLDFSPLDQCRTFFCELLGQAVDWGKDD